MRHFRVTVSCQAVETSMLVCLDKDLQRDKIHDICKACVKDNYDVNITAIRLRHNDTTTWISLEQMVQELVDLKLYKVNWVAKLVGIRKVNHGQTILLPSYIRCRYATVSHEDGVPYVHVVLEPVVNYVKIDYEGYAHELNGNDLKVTFSDAGDGINIWIPNPYKIEDLNVEVNRDDINICWKENCDKWETVQENIEL